jgi:hypothetical protein
MGRAHAFLDIPIIDASNPDTRGSARRGVAEQLGAACRERDVARTPARAVVALQRFLGGKAGRGTAGS